MLFRVKSILFSLILALTLYGVATQALCQQAEEHTGFYLILAESTAMESVPAQVAGQQIVRYDYKYIRQEEKQSAKYLLISKRPNVPLLLARSPEKTMGDDGRTLLFIELTQKAAANLEKLSRENLGKQVALVIDGEIVSIHKIRSVITDGKFRLSRCTDNACEYIYSRLSKR
jgi:preprotein translocase subunit SecD